MFLLLFAAGLKSFAFDLILTKTDETCTGNGALQFHPENNDPLATFSYRIFKHPDLINPIAVVTTNSFGGLQSGTYRVIAEQTLNGVTSSEFRDIEIVSLIVPMTYAVSGINAFCGPDGQISVNVTAGAASSFEIMAGPVIRAPQPSPVFTNVPAGVYQIRVFDTCGEGFVQNFTLFSDSATLNISPGTIASTELPSCNTVLISNTITPSLNDDIPYPLSVEFTVFPPDGSTPITVTTSIASGSPDSMDAEAIIPFYYGQSYTYTIKITDPCGAVYTLPNNVVNAEIFSAMGPVNAPCQQFYLTTAVYNYVAPITITFDEFPDGFDPVAFNPGHPGPFVANVNDYGSDDQPVPFGFYAITITDACGRTTTAEYDLTPPTTPPDVIVTITGYPGCQNLSMAEIEIAGFVLVGATITDAPDDYPHAVPHDVTAAIIDNVVVLDPLIPGDYTIEITDDCGNTHVKDFVIPEGSTLSVLTSSWPGCGLGKGSIRIAATGGQVLSVIVQESPAAAGFATGTDLSYNIEPTSGVFYMADLPPGTYKFDILDSCGGLHEDKTINVVGYQVTLNDHLVTPHCGSFDLTLNHTANGVSQNYWLQREDPDTGNWHHPQTGQPYAEGEPLSATNAYPLTNNATNFNIGYTGTFRIIKGFQSFANGSEGGGFKTCIETLAEFDFFDGFNITQIERLTCDGQFSDIAIHTDGVPPLTFKIKSKNGDTSFVIDNGTDNIFTNLESATYEFEVQHACGHIRNIIVNIGNLPSVAEVPDPADMPSLIECDDINNDGQATFDLTQNNAAVLGSQNPANYTITYYLSDAAAQSATDAIPSTYTGGTATIYIRLQHNPSTCFGVTSFQVVVNPYPTISFDTSYPVCDGASVTVTAPPGMVSYLWSDGQSGQQATFTLPGNYVLSVDNGLCVADYPFVITPSAPPVIQTLEISDWTDNQNSIEVILGNPQGSYSYSLDGIHFQDSNIFDGLLPGNYTVFVKSDACGMTSEQVYLLMYPKFFTPNGDGYNDYWRVKFSEAEPGLKTFVYDRYGKLITGFMPDSPGWDGLLNGRMLPSTDYWFVVVRENGKELRGHFSMKR